MANDFISPVGLPEKGVRIWILGQSDFALGQTSLVILLAVLRSHAGLGRSSDTRIELRLWSLAICEPTTNNTNSLVVCTLRS